MSKVKESLTNDIRKAGISKKDEDFMDQFSADMLDKKDTKKATTTPMSLTQVDEETSKKLAKAKKMNAKIFKEIHPKEHQQ